MKKRVPKQLLSCKTTLSSFIKKSGNFFVSFLIVAVLASNFLYSSAFLHAQEQPPQEQPPQQESFQQQPQQEPPQDSNDNFSLPQECQTAGINDPQQCDQFMRDKNTQPTQQPSDFQQQPTQDQQIPQDHQVNDENQQTTQNEFSGPQPDQNSDFPDACRQAGISDPARCAEFMRRNQAHDRGDFFDGQPGDFDRPFDEARHNEDTSRRDAAQAPQCQKDCGQCQVCRGSECQNTPFGTPDHRCGEGKVCDGHGGCVGFQKSDNLSEENRRVFEKKQREIQDALRNRPERQESQGQVPAMCQDQGITDFKKCETFLQKARRDDIDISSSQNDNEKFGQGIPPECAKAGLSTESSCREFMLKRHGAPQGDFKDLLPPPCQEKALIDPAACFAFMKEGFSGAGGPAEGFDRRDFGNGEGRGEDRGRFGPRDGFSGRGPNDFEGRTGEFSGGLGGSHGEFQGPDFANFLPQECSDAGVTTPDGCQNLMFSLNMPEECRNNPNIKTPKDCEKFMFKKFAPPVCDGVNTPQECEARIVKKHLPPECTQAGATTPQECEAIMSKDFMPKVCTDQGATSEDACAKIMFATHGAPKGCENIDPLECKRRIQEGEIHDDAFFAKMDQELPNRCREIGATSFQQCEEIMRKKNFPAECREAGAFTRHACERVMMEKYSPTPEQFPKACQDEGATTPDSCRRVMVSKHMPKECRDANISEPKQCEELLARKHMPKECVVAQAFDRESCEKIMRDKFLAPLCKEQGINDEASCRDLMQEKFAKKFHCKGDLSQEECALSISKRHIGQIVKKNEELKDARKHIKKAVGRHLALGKRGLTPGRDGALPPGAPVETPPIPTDLLEEEEASIVNAFPLLEDEATSVLVLGAQEVNSISEDEVIITTLAAAITFDDDQDGLPNDLETRIGTDVNNADSDGDGFLDGEEVGNNFSPVGDGSLEYNLSPIDEAIINGATLEQPVDSGELDEDAFEVTDGLVDDAQGDQAVPDDVTSRIRRYFSNLFPSARASEPSPQGIHLAGRAVANTVVTLYIYSDVPIIATTKTDASGQWNYWIDKDLKDGEHTVYVAQTDSNGKVVKKSNPFTFLIKEAQAVTPQEFIAPTAVVAESGLAGGQWMWAIGGLVVFVLLITVVMLFVKKKHS